MHLDHLDPVDNVVNLDQMDNLVPLESRVCPETRDHLDHLDLVVHLDLRYKVYIEQYYVNNFVKFDFCY